MIRRSTMIWIVLSIAIGAGLFRVSYQVRQQEDELARISRAILENQKKIHVLHAEWAYLNRPQRLQALNDRHLRLHPVLADQLVGFSDVPYRRTALGNDDATLASVPDKRGGAR